MFESGKRKKGEERNWGVRSGAGGVLMMKKVRERLSDCMEKEAGE